MDSFKVVIIGQAFSHQQWRGETSGDRRQGLVGNELDVLAEFTWPWAGAVRRLTAGTNTMLARLRPRARSRIEPTTLPSVAATA